MRRYTNAMLLIVLAAIVTGCKSAPAGEPADPAASTQPTPAQSFDLGELSYIFEIPAEPVDVAVTLDTAGTVEALIPVEGGSISATGADGTVYTLEIPADALLNETLIGLTPVTSVADLPFGGEQTYAVQLSPEGLFLFNYAILTITPAQEIPLGEQIFFGYLEDGKDLILAAPVVDSSEIQIRVQHFSGNGVTKGLHADAEQARERLGGSVERRLESAISAEMTRLRSEGGGGVETIATYAAFERAFNQYEQQVVKLRVDAAGDSCAAAMLAWQSVVKLWLWRFEAGFISTAANPFDKYPGLMDKFVRVCVQEEYELCVEEHIIHNMLPLFREVSNLPAMLRESLSDAVLQEARDLTVKCLTFRLEFESTGSVDAGGGGFTSTVKAEIILRFNPDDFTIRGEAPMVVENFEMRFPGCTVSNYVNEGGTFKVFRLTILDEPYETYGRVRDFILSYFPGITSASYDVSCPGGTFHVPPGAAWTAAFLLHNDELATGLSDEEIGSDAGFLARDWEILSSELFATKGWSKEASGVTEAGTFKLYHTPGE